MVNARKVAGVTFFYEAERVKYSTALQRCVDFGLDLCNFRRTAISNQTHAVYEETNTWRRKGE